MRDDQRRGWSYVPVSCCLSATGIRFSGHPCPAEDWAFLAVGLPDNARTPSGFHVSHVRVATGEGALSTPRTAVLTRPTASLRSPPAASQRQCPYTPAEHPSSGAQLDEASLRVHCIHPSGLPLACGPRMERAPLGFSPELRTPPLPATHVRVGTGLEHWPGTTQSTSSVDPPSYESTRIVRPRVAPCSGCCARNGTLRMLRSERLPALRCRFGSALQG
jgi:hypothetical protein